MRRLWSEELILEAEEQANIGTSRTPRRDS
jgi:hypothetical protein